ncbi:MAG TPA: hypothetical protein VGJ92_05190 [Methanocella sp.]|jgi:hypothetical protein
MKAVDHFKRYWWFYVALLLIVIFALYYRAGVPGQPGAISNFVIPTWGNTMYHVGIERVTLETGHYPSEEISYGGGFPNFYVPGYRLLVVALSAATGIDPMPMSGLVVLLLSTFCLLAVCIVAYRMSGGNYYVALFAAFFFLMSPDMTINTERPFPELMGLFILPLALYFALREDWLLATLMAITMALTHQQSVLALVGIFGLYSLFQLLYAIAYTRKYRKFLASLIPIVAACGMYAAWQMYTMGTLNITKIAQLTYHEQWPVTLSTILETGAFVLLFLFIGLFYVFALPIINRLLRKPDAPKKEAEGKPAKSYALKVSADAKMLLVAWMVGALILTKNEWIHILSFSMNTLQSRFYTYFVDVAIVLAGFGMYALLAAIDFKPLLEGTEPEPEETAERPTT